MDDDRTRMERHVIGEGIAAAPSVLFDGDDYIRGWVDEHKDVLPRQSVEDKVRMIKELLSGKATDDDVNRVITICEQSSPADRAKIRPQVDRDVLSVKSGKNRTRIRIVLWN